MFDIHDSRPNQKIEITRVGAEGVKLVLRTAWRRGVNVLYPTVNVYVDLPLDKKGIHVSRSLESLNEIIGEVQDRPVRFLENLCARIAKNLLAKHEYSSRAEVTLRADYYISRRTPVSMSVSGETCVVYAAASAVRVDGEVRVKKFIGADVYALTYCPCVMEGLRRRLKEDLEGKLKLDGGTVKKILKLTPIASHNQRCKIFAMVETSRRVHIDLDELINILEASASSPTYSLLKRGDELQVILNAHSKPMFVEDVLREVLYRVIKRYPELPDDAEVHVRVTSEESIHKYNIVSEHKTRVGVVREKLNLKR